LTEEKLTCPKCGEQVAKEDNFCKKCGADLRHPIPVHVAPPSEPTLPIPPEMPPLAPPPPPYRRRYGTITRLFRILFQPSETLSDIALAPDYGGVFIVLVLQTVLAIISVAFAFSKFEVTGPYAGVFLGIVFPILILALGISFILTPVRWLIKSVIVWKLCDKGSGWKFKSAASVTGYAYIANLIVSLVILPLLPFVFPVMRIDTSNWEVASRALDTYRAQLVTTQLYLALPTLFALIWKSYLGGIGTHYGTKKWCMVSSAFWLFFLLGLISVAISFIT